MKERGEPMNIQANNEQTEAVAARETLSALEPLTVTVRDVTRLSGLGPTTVWRLISEGKLESTMVGNRRLVSVSSLKKLLAPQTT